MKYLIALVFMVSIGHADTICVSGGERILICTDEDGNTNMVYLPYIR